MLLARKLLFDQLVPFLFELPQLGLAFLLKFPGGVDKEVDPGPDGLLFSDKLLPLALLGLKVGLAFELMPLEFLLQNLEILLTDIGLSNFDGIFEFVFFPIEFLALELVVCILVVDFLPVVSVRLIFLLFICILSFFQLVFGIGKLFLQSINFFVQRFILLLKFLLLCVFSFLGGRFLYVFQFFFEFIKT